LSRRRKRLRSRPGIAIAADYGGGEAISPSDYGFHKARLLRIVLQHGTYLADGDVDAVIDIEENIFSPEVLCNLVAGYQLAGPLDQEEEQVHGEFLQPQKTLPLSQLITGRIEREIGEMKFLGRKNPRELPDAGC